MCFLFKISVIDLFSVKSFLIFAFFVPAGKEQSFTLRVKNVSNPENMGIGLWPQLLEIGQLLAALEGVRMGAA
jgi:hypothetical protein